MGTLARNGLILEPLNKAVKIWSLEVRVGRVLNFPNFKGGKENWGFVDINEKMFQ